MSAEAALSAVRIVGAASAEIDASVDAAATTALADERNARDVTGDSAAALGVLSSAIEVEAGGEVGAAVGEATGRLGSTLLSVAAAGGASDATLESPNIAIGVQTGGGASALALPGATQISATVTPPANVRAAVVTTLYAVDIHAPAAPSPPPGTVSTASSAAAPAAPAAAELAALFADAPQLLAADDGGGAAAEERMSTTLWPCSSLRA